MRFFTGTLPYGFESNPVVNLYVSLSLEVTPVRTDDWPKIAGNREIANGLSCDKEKGRRAKQRYESTSFSEGNN